MAGSTSNVSGVAERYANALFELALEEKALPGVEADLDRFAALIDESPDLKRLVRSPVFSSDEQLRAVDAGDGVTLIRQAEHIAVTAQTAAEKYAMPRRMVAPPSRRALAAT